MRIADYFKKNRDELEENAGNIVKNLTAANVPICGQHNDAWGGFGDAPKSTP